MATKKYVVRIVIPDIDSGTIDGAFLDSLRYAGLITTHSSDSGQVFDLICPKGLDSKSWSERNAARMQSFGFNAVSAPSTGDC